MSHDDNERLVRRLYDEYLNPGHFERLGEIVSPDFAGAGGVRGPAAFSASIGELRKAFPDLAYTVEDVVAGDDRVAVRWTVRGTHTAEFKGFAPTGKKMANSGFAIFEIAGGKLVRASVLTDRLSFLQLVGAVPVDPRLGPPPAAN